MALPNKDQLLEWIRDNPANATKRDIARAFGVKGADRIELKRVLRDMADAGEIQGRAKRFQAPGHLPPVGVMVGDTLDRDGELWARPQKWEGDGAPPPVLVVTRKGEPPLGLGDTFLARLSPIHEEDGLRYEARLIRKLNAGARRALGVLQMGERGLRLIPVEKGADEMRVDSQDAGGAEPGELVEVELIGSPRMGLRRARVIDRLGDPMAPRAFSLIAIRQHGIETEFSDEALAEAESAAPVALGKRTDLRHLPLATIDPPDARDHDDAVAALPDDASDNPGGWIVWVAIADVAAYVRPGSALDKDARRRGNSTYFPDRVAPMLPEALSADLCSLHEGEDRPCIAARIRISADGEKLDHRFERGLMRSRASLSYAAAQAVEDGADHAEAAAVRRLFAAYRATAQAREKRAPLHLDLPERRIELDDAGRVASVAFRDRFDAHKLIEDFMILANVCAAETLEAAKRPLIYRVHEEPALSKLEALREQIETVGLTLAKGQVLKTGHLNALLDGAAGGPYAEFVNMSVLRAQTQAYYHTQNFGHFGLNLRRYAHFTSPIRRYADLTVHRALIAAHGWGADGQTPEEAEALEKTAERISRSERTSMAAERDTNDRYLAAFLAEHEGAEFEGRVTGIAKFGLFVRLDDTGADGFIPIGTLGGGYWRHDPRAQTLSLERGGGEIGLGARAHVRLVEVAPVAGGLRLEALEIEGAGKGLGRAQRGRSGGAPKRALGKAKRAALKAKRKKRG